MKTAMIEGEEYLMVSNSQTIHVISMHSASQVLELKVPMGMISEMAIA